jgi:outer membrane lipoprotein-sorting protein
MKNMKANILSIVFLFTISALALGQQDPEAEQYLNKIAKDLDPGYTIQLDFDYIREDLQDKSSIEGEGILYIFGDKYKLEMEDFIIYFDGEKQYSLNLDIEEVYISIPDPNDKEFMFSDPIRLLRSYKDEFKYVLMGKSDIQGIAATEIQLNPLELGGPYSLLKLFVAPSKELKAIQVRQKAGILYSMIIKSFKKIDQPANTFFQFSAIDYPNVDVIDLLN